MGLGNWLTQRKANKAETQRARKRAKDGCTVYEFGGGWGDALTWMDFREGKVQG
jgi:hypothetical protein